MAGRKNQALSGTLDAQIFFVHCNYAFLMLLFLRGHLNIDSDVGYFLNSLINHAKNPSKNIQTQESQRQIRLT